MGHPRPELQHMAGSVVAGAGTGQGWKLPTPGLTWAWAYSSSRAGFQDTINFRADRSLIPAMAAAVCCSLRLRPVAPALSIFARQCSCST